MRLARLILLLCFMSSAAYGVEPAQIRTAVERSLPYIQEQGQWWADEKKCVSCHRVSFTTWTLLEASEKGFDVDREKLATLRAWSRDNMSQPPEEGKPVRASTNLDGVSQVLWSERKHLSDPSVKPWRDQMLTLLREGQEESGQWEADGQLPFQKRPKPETHLVSTMWHALALGTVPQKSSQEARAKAMAQIVQAKPGDSTEWYVARLLLAVQSGSGEETNKWAEALKSRQREDGSWSWIGTEVSDPIGTGMAIYALRHASVPIEDSSLKRGAEYLVGAQNDQGIWLTAGTKPKAKGKPVETSNYWGTCWATIGLLSLLQ